MEALEPDDVKALRSCREGACDVQLPATSIQVLHDGVDFTRPNAAEQANELGRPMTLRLFRSYRQGGHLTLGEYRDKQNPARIGEQFETMVSRASVLPDVIPELRRYLHQRSSEDCACPYQPSRFRNRVYCRAGTYGSCWPSRSSAQPPFYAS
jgi:hypothetical protein